tara:strand:+ start:598 stop:1152 length:555 start_codon:yes stop_codon:yes gene_type:complete
MYKYLIIAILLSACATTPPPIDYHYPFVSTTGAWETREIKDELDGNWRRSYVFTEKNSWIETNPGIFVDTYANGSSSLFFTNGDGYICDTGTLIVRVKFDNEEVLTLSNGTEFRLANNNERITIIDSQYYSRYRAKSEFLAKLPEADRVIIETQDSCGTIKQMKFNIEGSPHFIAVNPLDSFKN